MTLAVQTERRRRWHAPAVSLAGHLVVLALLALFASNPTAEPSEEPIAVEIVARPSSGPIVGEKNAAEAAGRPAGAQVKEDANPSRPVPAALPPSSTGELTGMVRPQRMLSGTALSGPLSGNARRALRTLATDERAIQLCSIEAMAQVSSWKAELHPQAVAPYAFSALRRRGASIVADGAAIYDAGHWVRLRYECDVVADKVVAFAFWVGDRVPKDQWEAHDLAQQPADDE